MADLFELPQLASYLHQRLAYGSADLARRVATGWLRSATRLDTWPDPVPDDLLGWALELAGMVYTNPEGLTTEVVGATTATRERGRRDAILAAARSAYGGEGVAGGPMFSFPEPDWSWSAPRPC